jgi:hypothetical protein
MATTAEPRTFATIEVTPNAQNLRYLQTKRAKLGHRLHHQDLKFEPEEQ